MKLFVLCEDNWRQPIWQRIVEADKDYSAAVGIVRYRNKWLLGLAKNASDDRGNKWVFPGGGIKPKETPIQAAVREVKEETGISCKATSDVLDDRNKKGVAFVVCRVTSPSAAKRLNPNHEFAHVAFFTEKQMKSLDLYKNVERLLKRANRYK